jgi:hypothetical protein
VLLFYRRIQNDVYNLKWLLGIWFAISFTILYSIALVLALVLTCQPTESLWKSFQPGWKANHEYTCSNILAINFVSGILCTVSDAYTFLLPVMMLQGLDISRRRRIGLYSIFAINVVVVAAGACRTWALHRFSSDKEGDITWCSFWIYFWSILEYELGLMCICAPAFRVFVTHYILRRRTIPLEEPEAAMETAPNQDVPQTTTVPPTPGSPPAAPRFRTSWIRSVRNSWVPSLRVRRPSEEENLTSLEPPFDRPPMSPNSETKGIRCSPDLWKGGFPAVIRERDLFRTPTPTSRHQQPMWTRTEAFGTPEGYRGVAVPTRLPASRPPMHRRAHTAVETSSRDGSPAGGRDNTDSPSWPLRTDSVDAVVRPKTAG